ncbi:MAG: HepT-like ribonuclease domain-containing protein [Nitrospiria bacterium]
MSKKRRDHILFLEDILEAIRKIEEYTKGISFKKFCENNMAIDAVIRNFEVIGEATKNIPKKIVEKYPDVEWKEAVGFRNILIHDYFGIDLEAVWETIRNNIPPYKKHVTEVLKSEQQGE